MFKGPKIKFDSDVQFSRLPSILENSLYRIAQEALTNACKHSKSENVTVILAQEGQEVRLEVQDLAFRERGSRRCSLSSVTTMACS